MTRKIPSNDPSTATYLSGFFPLQFKNRWFWLRQASRESARRIPRDYECVVPRPSCSVTDILPLMRWPVEVNSVYFYSVMGVTRLTLNVQVLNILKIKLSPLWPKNMTTISLLMVDWSIVPYSYWSHSIALCFITINPQPTLFTARMDGEPWYPLIKKWQGLSREGTLHEVKQKRV